MAEGFKTNDKKTSGKKTNDQGSSFPLEGAVILLILLFLIVLPAISPSFSFKQFGTTILYEESPIKPLLETWKHIVRPGIIILNLLLFTFITFLIFKIWPLQDRPRILRQKKTRERKIEKNSNLIKHWETVRKKTTNPTHDNLRIAIIEADSFVDLLLKRGGYGGDHMADRLSQFTTSEIPNLDRVWDAHRLRNRLVHTPGAAISPEEAEKALDVFEYFLKDLGVL